MIYLVIALATIGGMTHAEALAFVGQPFNTLAIGALVMVGLFHGTMGLEVVIEDYIPAKSGRHLETDTARRTFCKYLIKGSTDLC